MPVVAEHAQLAEISRAVSRAEDGGDELRKHRRPRRARDAHAERHDEDYVERDVQERREYKEVKRRPAVAERAQNVRYQVIRDRRARAEHDGEHIIVGHPVNFGRRVHPSDDRARRGAAENRQHDGEDERQQRGGRYRPPHAHLAARAEALPDADAEAARQPLHEAENEIDESPRRADRRERLRAHRAPDDDRIRERVKKLKQIAADNRQRKGEDRPRRTPRRQILNHSDAPPKFPARRANAARFRERIF